MPKAHYEVQSYDCHVINPNYNVGLPDNMLGPDASGKKISIMVIVVCNVLRLLFLLTLGRVVM